MWKAKTGEAVDGVIAIDPIGLQALIEVSGPVVVDGKLITKDNVVREMPPPAVPRLRGATRRPEPGATPTRRAASGRATSPAP